MPSLRVTLTALALAAGFSLQSTPAGAQQENQYGATEDDPRYSVQAAGSAGLGTWLLGTPAVGGSLEADVWGKRIQGALGVRAGALASGAGSEARHGTYYGGVVFSAYKFVGSGRVFASAMVGLASAHGAFAAADSATLTEAVVLRAGYLAPAGPVRLGIALDGVMFPNAGTALLVTPILDIPF